jgi:replicative DNA helicase
MTVSLLPATLGNVEGEAALIGALMIENSLVELVTDLVSPVDFYAPVHGRIYAAIVGDVLQGRAVQPVTLRPIFEDDEDMKQLGGTRYLVRLTADCQGLLAPRELAKQVRDLANRRRMRTGLIEAADACANMDRAITEIASDADTAIHAQTEAPARRQNIGDAVAGLIRSFDEPVVGVTCGLIPSLDDLIGVLRPGTMNVVAGRPGMGKTTVALNYARGAAEKGHGVQYFSLEMSAEDLGGKAITELCFDLDAPDRVPYVAIERRNPTRAQRASIMRAQEYLSRLPLTIVDEGSMTISRIRSMVRSEKRRMAAKGIKLDLVIIDYLQLVNADRLSRSMVETVTEVSRGLKALAMDEQVAVMALAQLSRAVEQRTDKRPVLSDLRESGQIEQDADAVMFLLREEHYLHMAEPDAASDKHEKWQADYDRVRGMIEFILAKKRLGSTGAAFGRFYGIYHAVRS